MKQWERVSKIASGELQPFKKNPFTHPQPLGESIMNSFDIRIHLGIYGEVITSREESNDLVTAVNMACNRLTKEERDQINDISISRNDKS